MGLNDRFRNIRTAFKQELRVYRFLCEDQRVPRLAKWALALAVAYALSPIDLIPDFVPLIGHLDDLLIVPALILFALWLMPSNVVGEARERAHQQL